MKFLFRVDSSKIIGSGHVMRCLTLADELSKRGADVMFICRGHAENLIGLIASKGYPVATLLKPAFTENVVSSIGIDCAAWLGAPWEQDAEETAAVVIKEQPDWLIIDHYAIDHRWESRLRPHVGRIMVIDDLADRHHDCDLLLDQNLYHDMDTRYEKLVPESCRRMVGPSFALLRPEFAAARKRLRKKNGEVKRVLVFFGGADPTNETEKALDALLGIAGGEFLVDVVVGAANPRKERIQDICADNARFNYHYQIDTMSDLMTNADLMIGAGGSTTWERCSLGLPALVVAVADNQCQLASCAAARGLFFYLGTSETVSVEHIRDSFKVFSSLPHTLLAVAENGLTLVDARGALRVASVLAPPQIVLRLADEQDCDAVYHWRNADETRQHIFDKDIIPLGIHRSWYRETLKNPNRILLIGEINGKPVGVLRYDFSGEEALISVYLVPGKQGYGIGSELLRCGSRWIKNNHPHIRTINAEILHTNVASLRAFAQAGYKEHHVTYKEVL